MPIDPREHMENLKRFEYREHMRELDRRFAREKTVMFFLWVFAALLFGGVLLSR